MNDLFFSEEEKVARSEYIISVYGEGLSEETAEELLAEKYGKEIAHKIAEEVRGWN